MGLKKVQRIDEGPMDFMRGAGAMAGRKVAQSAPVQAVKRGVGDVMQAGRDASAAGDFSKAVINFAQLYAKYMQMKGSMPQQQEPAAAPEQQAGTPAGPDVQAKQAEIAKARQSRATPPGAPEAFRTTQKPKGRMGQHGFEYTFNSFMQDISGEAINEGAWDFVKGAGAAVAGKAREAINTYANKPSIFKDMYSAGKAASQAGDAKKQAAEFEQVKQQTLQALQALVAQMKTMGDNGPKVLQQAVAKLPQDQQQAVMGIIMKNVQRGAK